MPALLNDSPAEIIQAVLVSLGLGYLPSVGGSEWPVYSANEPDSPDNVITVYDTLGRQDGRDMTAGERQEHPGFQIRVRATDHKVGYLKARTIAVSLDEQVKNLIVGVETTRYLVVSVSRTGDVLSIGKDTPTTKRSIFTINGVAAVKLYGSGVLLGTGYFPDGYFN